jgi:flagellar export protein FliJ
MKGLASLIKLHKRKLDELRREMSTLENQKEQLKQSSANLTKELQDEMNAAKKQAELSAFFGGFAKRIQKRQEEIAEEIKELDKKITTLNDEIADAFTELKKFEIAQENEKRRADEDTRRKETIVLDDIAGQQFRQKKKED